MSHQHSQRFRSAHSAGHDSRKNPHFDQQAGTRVVGSIGAKISLAGAGVERDSDPPEVTTRFLLSYLTREIRKLVATEALATVVDSLASTRKGRIDTSGKPDEQKFGKLFEDKLLSDLIKAIKKRFDAWIEGLSKAQFEAMRL